MAASDHLSTQFYHVSHPDNRYSISRHGLDWTRGPHAEHPLQGYDDDGNIVDLPRANYLYRTAESARERAGSTGEDVYEVRGSGLRIHPDPYEDSEAVLTPDPIPANRLRRV